MKPCTACRETKGADAFHKRRASPDGLALICRDCSRAKAQAYYLANKDRLKTQAGAWNARNPEKRRAIVAAHHVRHLDASRLAARAKSSNRRALCGTMDAEAVSAVLASSGGECVYCGVIAPLSVDHVDPVIKGGTNSRDNLLPCCKPCNSSKGAKPVEEWLLARHGIEGLARAVMYLEASK